VYYSGHSAFLFILYVIWEFLIKKLHEVVALQKNVCNMYENFDLLDMGTSIHTNTSNSNSVSFKYVSSCNILPQKKNKSGSYIFDLVPRFKENFLCPAVFIYLFIYLFMLYS